MAIVIRLVEISPLPITRHNKKCIPILNIVDMFEIEFEELKSTFNIYKVRSNKKVLVW
jgi:hypothetical protein